MFEDWFFGNSIWSCPFLFFFLLNAMYLHLHLRTMLLAKVNYSCLILTMVKCFTKSGCIFSSLIKNWRRFVHDSFCHGFLYPICCTPPDCTACDLLVCSLLLLLLLYWLTLLELSLWFSLFLTLLLFVNGSLCVLEPCLFLPDIVTIRMMQLSAPPILCISCQYI